MLPCIYELFFVSQRYMFFPFAGNKNIKRFSENIKRFLKKTVMFSKDLILA